MEIEVSVLCTAYNHEKYIRECLEGFVNQTTKFEFEVLVHDDASTDSTASIIREYEQKYPNIIQGIYQKENQYSKGRYINLDILLPLAKGKYIAFCEGDDYWCDSNKLQSQYDALEKHPQCFMTVHRTQKMNEEGIPYRSYIPSKKAPVGIINQDDFIQGKPGKSGFHVSSFFVRTKALREYAADIPLFRKCVNFGDIPYQLYFGCRGPIYCVRGIMSRYRTGSINSWSSQLSAGSIKKMDEHYDMVAKMFKEFDKYSNGRYHDYCQFKQLSAEYWKLYARGEYRTLIRKKYRRVFNSLSLRQKVGFYYRYIRMNFKLFNYSE